jgi:glycosyltransferase involved in cell wall biosynthesis
MVTLEAMGCAMPIVGSRKGAIPELLASGTGTLVPPGDAPAIARALLDYGRSPQLREEHGRAARERAVAQFDIAGVAETYLAVIAEMAERRARA